VDAIAAELLKNVGPNLIRLGTNPNFDEDFVCHVQEANLSIIFTIDFIALIVHWTQYQCIQCIHAMYTCSDPTGLEKLDRGGIVSSVQEGSPPP
jgi:hypothetical protein